MAYNKVEERSRSVGCAITFHRANVIAGPVRAKKDTREGMEEKGGKEILYVPVSSEPCVKRKRGFREINTSAGG